MLFFICFPSPLNISFLTFCQIKERNDSFAVSFNDWGLIHHFDSETCKPPSKLPCQLFFCLQILYCQTPSIYIFPRMRDQVLNPYKINMYVSRVHIIYSLFYSHLCYLGVTASVSWCLHLYLLNLNQQVDGLDWEQRLSSTLPTPRDPRVVRLLLEAGARLSTEEDRGEAGDGESGCERAEEVVTSSQVCIGCIRVLPSQLQSCYVLEISVYHRFQILARRPVVMTEV
jgi:hypothetical protein